jgi:hypothetical protein
MNNLHTSAALMTALLRGYKMSKYDIEIARIMKLAAPHLIDQSKGFTVSNFNGTEDEFEYFASLFQDAVFA